MFRLPGGTPSRLVVLLHGGTGRTEAYPHGWRNPAHLLMLTFVPVILWTGGRQVAVAAVHHPAGGWLRRVGGSQGGWHSDVDRLHQVLDDLRVRHGRSLPVTIVGHSSGGWAALRAASAAAPDDVDAVLAIAPWVSPTNPPRISGAPYVVIAHGRQDRVTSPIDSQAVYEQLVQAGVDAAYVAMPGGHTLIRHWFAWRRVVARFTRKALTRAPRQG
ncbi:MAG: alpha/beta fold hydrolase [Austwickia sp.]|nr:alpha/beta fold hydrolase [Austwickia sp.]